MVEGIVLNIKGQRIELTLEEARALAASLNGALKSNEPPKAEPFPWGKLVPFNGPVHITSVATAPLLEPIRTNESPARPFADIWCEKHYCQ